MNDRLGYWPIGDNSCDEVKGCKGAGSSGHIDHVLSRLPFNKLVGAILSCCGGERGGPNPVMSCMCCFYAREIGYRATSEGYSKHRKAVEEHKKYVEKKYPPLNADGAKKEN